jgi:hypothetical protein
MPRRSKNVQLFALRQSPPETLILRGRQYRLVRVFKHDFFAATCLYEAVASAKTDIPRIVVKFGRTQELCGLPLGWYGRWLCRHERDIYRRLTGLPGVPRWIGCVDGATFAIESSDARPLDHLDAPPSGFFDRLLEVFGGIHARGVAYCDANKQSNILVDALGRPFVIDFQISIRRHDDWPWPLRTLAAAIVRQAQQADIYHLYKHKRRLAPGELTSQEDQLSRRRGWLHMLHRKLSARWRDVRRWFLRSQYKAGRLESPTAELEDHHQPEKDIWRNED